jgi:hypothetical protein
MHLKLGDSIYTERLASFLGSLGQASIISGPAEIELLVPEDDRSCEIATREIAIYLRVWGILYPDAEVKFVGADMPDTSRAEVVGAS